MPRGGPRPNTGGRRAGAGRNPSPRLTPEQTADALRLLGCDGSPAAHRELADRLRLTTPTEIRRVYREGATVQQVERWRALLLGGSR